MRRTSRLVQPLNTRGISSRTTPHTRVKHYSAEHHSLPENSTWHIKARITQNLQKYNAELTALGGPTGDGNSGNIILSVITEFTAEFRTTIDDNTNDISLNELSGGARIGFVFHELFNNDIKNIDPLDQVKDADIRTILISMLYNSSVSLLSPISVPLDNVL